MVSEYEIMNRLINKSISKCNYIVKLCDALSYLCPLDGVLTLGNNTATGLVMTSGTGKFLDKKCFLIENTKHL